MTEGQSYVLPVVLLAQREDGLVEPVLLDKIAGKTIVIQYEHHEIHEGNTWEFSYMSPHGSEIANDATLILVFGVASLGMHFTFVTSGGGSYELELLEGVSYTDGEILEGCCINMNRIAGTCTCLVLTLDPTLTDDGTKLFHTFRAGGAGSKSAGSVARPTTERILKPNTNYAIRITNRSGSTQLFSVNSQYYLRGG